MRLTKVLEGIGLTDKEARVYLALLSLHEALPSAISKKAGVKRPTTYVILGQLQAKGLVSSVTRGKTTYYRALNPYTLLEDQHNRYTALQKSLPELVSLHETYSATPQMTIFEGKEGIMKIMDDTLTASTELLNWNDVERATAGALLDYYPTYTEVRVKKKTWVRGIVSYDKISLDFKRRGKDEFREIYLIPKAKFPFRNEINIYDDKMAIISHEDNIGVIVQNKYIAETQRSIFKFAFEYAKHFESHILSKEDKEFLSK